MGEHAWGCGARLSFESVDPREREAVARYDAEATGHGIDTPRWWVTFSSLPAPFSRSSFARTKRELSARGLVMIRLHSTRLMRGGEVALWHRGKIVWQGSVGADVRGVMFDAVSLSTDDSARITARIWRACDR
jgi:hypothetical protein